MSNLPCPIGHRIRIYFDNTAVQLKTNFQFCTTYIHSHHFMKFWGEYIHWICVQSFAILLSVEEICNVTPQTTVFCFLHIISERGNVEVLNKLIYPKYSKHWPYLLAYTMDCECSKILNHCIYSYQYFYGQTIHCKCLQGFTGGL